MQAWRRWDELDEQTKSDLRTYVGWTRASDEVRSGETLTDAWIVLGAHRSDDGRLQQQRTWLHGHESGRTVQLLDFTAGGAPLPMAQLAGSVLDATLALYPGSRPQRALVVGTPSVRSAPAAPRTGVSLRDALADLAAAWAVNPWNPRVPVVLASAALVPDADGKQTQVVDTSGASIPLLAEAVPWDALALTGGRATMLVGELEEAGLRVLSIRTELGLAAV